MAGDERDLLRLALISNAHRATDGESFVLDQPKFPPALWGRGDQIIWADGEELIICGPDGVGKTAIAQQLMKRRLGLGSGELFGLPVAPGLRRTLCVFADRPSQAQRSMARMFTSDDADVLRERLSVWRGPLPYDIGKEPDFLTALAQHYDADTVLLDSLKDVAMDLSKDDVGARVNQAIQTALAEGIQIVSLHHQRKAQAGASAPRALSDVYGSRWLTAGAGSVLMLWGEPGDAVIDGFHLKQPLEDCGPFKIHHDHHHGVSTLEDAVDVYQVVQGSHKGITAVAVACLIYSKTQPNRNEIEKARRRLERLHRDGKIHKREGARGGINGGEATMYFPIAQERS